MFASKNENQVSSTSREFIKNAEELVLIYENKDLKAGVKYTKLKEQIDVLCTSYHQSKEGKVFNAELVDMSEARKYRKTSS